MQNRTYTSDDLHAAVAGVRKSATFLDLEIDLANARARREELRAERLPLMQICARSSDKFDDPAARAEVVRLSDEIEAAEARIQSLRTRRVDFLRMHGPRVEHAVKPIRVQAAERVLAAIESYHAAVALLGEAEQIVASVQPQVGGACHAAMQLSNLVTAEAYARSVLTVRERG